MNTIKKLLIPVDFSESAVAAIKYAVGMTKRDNSAKCDLIFIAGEHTAAQERTAVKKKLTALKNEYFVPAHIACDLHVQKGELTEVLLACKASLASDIIVMGTAGSSSVDAESETAKFLKHADYPVLVVPQNVQNFQLNNIALALDEKEIDDSSSLSVLHDIARWYGAKIHLLTVDREHNSQPPSLGANADTLEYYLDTLDYHHCFAQNTDIELGLRDYVEEKNIDILAIMPRNHAKHSEPSEGRLTQTLALHSTKPLLVID